MTTKNASGPIVATETQKTTMNGHSFKPNRMKSESLDAQRQKAQEAIQAAEADLLRLQEEEQSEIVAQRARLGQVRETHLMDAENFRAVARQETDEEEKRTLLRLAREDEQRAFEIGQELGLDQSQPDRGEEKPRLPLLKRPVVALLQVVGILAAIAFCYRQFIGLQTYIQGLNEKLPVEKHLQPYDITSIQKFFFEKLVVFSDLPVALAILFLIVPFMGFYVLPVLRSKKDFYTEFNEELTPWQRSLITTIFCLGLLFFLALSHSVKP
ncbi:hypothetical protein [Larkinella punicea]|uniref:Uncharacterized protein n=1 Tax=Larkinella punicea TaxID=2315727 RepID=A0A368JPJ2_9BACT|nr:hypothetical protein [Larkinella punicea]RCR69412.1 hypothetical protein DUE52_11205 [Larkinella punicea]